MPTETESSSIRAPLQFQEAYKLYEDGKHRRYQLLFSVNGGAFAIAKLLGSHPELGGLRLPYLAIGMALFSATMVYDIYEFGNKWHIIAEDIQAGEHYTIFGRPGKLVLIFIGLLICVGWILVAGFGR